MGIHGNREAAGDGGVMDDMEMNRKCAEAMGWKHLGAIGVELSEAERGSPSRADKAYPGKLWCLSGGNDWWLNPEGHHVCGPCQGIPDPLHDKAQCFELIERFRLDILDLRAEWSVRYNNDEDAQDWQMVQDADLNRAICLCVAQLHTTQPNEPGGEG